MPAMHWVILRRLWMPWTAAMVMDAAPAVAQSPVDSLLMHARVRVFTGQPASLRVKGRALTVSADTIIVAADPLPRMTPTREAVARRDITRLEVSRSDYRVATALALVFALPGAYVYALSPVGSAAGPIAIGIGGLLGFAIGRRVNPTRWERIPTCGTW